MDKESWTLEGRNGLIDALARLNDEQLHLVNLFTQQVLEASSLDEFKSMLTFQHDARIASLIELASEIDDDDLDQLLFWAEDSYAEVVNRSRNKGSL